MLGFNSDESADDSQSLQLNGADERKSLAFTEPEDLVRFGIIPEFVGRLPVVASLEQLTEEDLIKILTEPKNAVTRQYIKLFAMEKVKLVFEHDALVALAKKAAERGTGARGLRSIIEKMMVDIMFDLPDMSSKYKECIVTAATVKTGVPEYRK